MGSTGFKHFCAANPVNRMPPSRRIGITESLVALLNLSTILDDHGRGRLARARSDRFDPPDGLHPGADLAEDDVPPVQPRGLLRADEELRAVRVAPGVGHREDAWPGMPQREALVRELPPVDGPPARPVVSCEIAPLAHEARDHAVEAGAPVPVPLLPGAERAEVLGGLGGHVGSEHELHAAGVLAADLDVEVAPREHRPRWRGGVGGRPSGGPAPPPGFLPLREHVAAPEGGPPPE
mmetsp:Transcript_11178/g.27477  ORF Transcript_11178/g.27477 Transcript_11178/m.27477 type:complete len:237 (+) Transcript_11178:2682-3392(+)